MSLATLQPTLHCCQMPEVAQGQRPHKRAWREQHPAPYCHPREAAFCYHGVPGKPGQMLSMDPVPPEFCNVMPPTKPDNSSRPKNPPPSQNGIVAWCLAHILPLKTIEYHCLECLVKKGSACMWAQFLIVFVKHRPLPHLGVAPAALARLSLPEALRT
jgi:hypothetical protein